MDFDSFRQAAAARAQELGIAEYELYYSSGESTSVDAFQHEINEFSSSTDGGVCFRCVVDGKMGYASTEALTAEQAVSIVDRAVENAACLESQEPAILVAGGGRYEDPHVNLYELPQTGDMIHAALESQDQLYASDPKVIDGCQSTCLRMRSEIAIWNSKGLDLHYVNHVAGLMAMSVVSDGQEMTDDYEIKLGKLDTLDIPAITKKATERALRKLGGDVPPTAVCPVVFAPSAMSSLLATFSGIFSSENAQKGLSKLAGKEGSVIASPAVTLVDDPFYPDSPAPIHFDAEGSPTRKKNVVEAGRLNTLLYNLKTAAVAGRETTGNASKSNYDSPVGIRPFTMYLASGELTEEQLLEKAGSGVYITSLGGLHAGANPITGDFSLQSSGFLIENGKKTVPVKSFTVAGSIYGLLKQITSVGSNLELPHATGMTAYGSPSVLVENLSVAGK